MTVRFGRIRSETRDPHRMSTHLLVEVEIDEMAMRCSNNVARMFHERVEAVVDEHNSALRESYAPHTGRTLENVRR